MSQLLEFLQTHEEAFRSRARLASLYSDFRYQRSTNLDGYVANSNAWLQAFASAATAGLLPTQSDDRFILHTGEQLVSALQTQDFGRPLALSSVVHDAIQAKNLLPLEDYLNASGSVYARTWVPSPWQVMQWGLRHLGILGSRIEDGERLSEGKLVIMTNLEAASKSILDVVTSTFTSNSSRIYSRDLFATTFAPVLGLETLSPTDCSVILTYISRDRGIATYSASAGVVKFMSPSEQKPTPIVQEDISIASLRSLILSLDTQVSTLTKRVADLDTSAREAVSSKRLLAAKGALRQKKQAEATLQQRSAALAQLEAVYTDIERAADQVEMVDVMREAGRTLKSLNARTGGVEAVQDVVEGLREEMMNVEEIGTAINEVSAGDVDEGEVEDELELLEKAQAEEVEKQKNERQSMEEGARDVDAQTEEMRKQLAELSMLEAPKEEVSVAKQADEAEQSLA